MLHCPNPARRLAAVQNTRTIARSFLQTCSIEKQTRSAFCELAET